MSPQEPVTAESIDRLCSLAQLPLPAERRRALAPMLAQLVAAANVGFDAEGLPVGMQVIGRPFDEATLFRLGHAYQQATDWHTRAPRL